MDNFDVFARGLGALGAGLTNGGTEARANERLQQLQAKAAMERLLKEAELKQQAEDNARAYAEEQRQARVRRILDASMQQQNELPTSGPSNAAIVQAALNPAPGPMRQSSPDFYRIAAEAAGDDPRAYTQWLANEQDRRSKYGVDWTPAFDQNVKESNSRIGENQAQEASAYASAAHSRGLESRDIELHPLVKDKTEADRAIAEIKRNQQAREEGRLTGPPVTPGPWSPETTQEDVDFWSKGLKSNADMSKAMSDAGRAAIAFENDQKPPIPKPGLVQKAVVGSFRKVLDDYVQVVSGVKQVKGNKKKAAQELLRQLQRLNPEAVIQDPEDEDMLLLSPNVYTMDDETGMMAEDATPTSSAAPGSVTPSSWGPNKPKPQ
jgi:hypothetical protein